MDKLAVLGTGAMGEALLRGIIGSSVLNAGQIRAFDLDIDRLGRIGELYGVGVAQSNLQAVSEADVVILAVKPQVVGGVLKEIRGVLGSERLVISIAAGLTLASLQASVPEGTPVIRCMPNTPCLVGKGIAALAPGSRATGEHLQLAAGLFRAVGQVVTVEEKLLDAVTALSGSGPAYFYLVVEALIDCGVLVGLPRDLARHLVVQTGIGSLTMLMETGAHPAQLRDQVASPAGTTVAAIRALEDGGLRRAFYDAVGRAFSRSRELGREG